MSGNESRDERDAPDELENAETGASAPLGERLMERGLLSLRQFQFARQKQRVEKLRLGALLIRYGLVPEDILVKELAASKGIPFVVTESLPPSDPEMLRCFNRELCLLNGFLPIRRNAGELEILLGDGDETVVAELAMQRTGLKCRFLQASFTEVTQRIRDSYYFTQHSIEDLLEREIRRLASDADHALSPEKCLDYLLHWAVHERATDIHLAPSATSLHLFFRIDGVLRPMLALPLLLTRLLVYIKLTSEMDISEQRKPQDGSFHSVVLDQPFAVRVSIICTEFGERIVLRLLPERSQLSSLEQLGFLGDDISRLERIFLRPAGMVLITGPTGSGKTTTMHAALQMQSLIESNVLTVEDPIEYRLPGSAQTEVNRRAGYDFSNALRFFLRHDPDVILIGEVRDSETAQAAVEAAATGHLVLSTLHAPNVFGIVPRLQLFGLGPQTVADNLIAVISQRLVRRNCPHCTVSVALTEKDRRALGGDAPIDARRGAGCPLCGSSGYLGRLPVYEILEMTQSLANLIADGAGRETIYQKTLAMSFRNMLDQAKWRVRMGQTTLEEVSRVVGWEHDE